MLTNFYTEQAFLEKTIKLVYVLEYTYFRIIIKKYEQRIKWKNKRMKKQKRKQPQAHSDGKAALLEARSILYHPYSVNS